MQFTASAGKYSVLGTQGSGPELEAPIRECGVFCSRNPRNYYGPSATPKTSAIRESFPRKLGRLCRSAIPSSTPNSSSSPKSRTCLLYLGPLFVCRSATHSGLGLILIPASILVYWASQLPVCLFASAPPSLP